MHAFLFEWVNIFISLRVRMLRVFCVFCFYYYYYFTLRLLLSYLTHVDMKKSSWFWFRLRWANFTKNIRKKSKTFKNRFTRFLISRKSVSNNTHIDAYIQHALFIIRSFYYSLHIEFKPADCLYLTRENNDKTKNSRIMTSTKIMIVWSDLDTFFKKPKKKCVVFALAWFVPHR